MDNCWTGFATWWPGSLSSLAWYKASATLWAWSKQQPHHWTTHPTCHGLQGTPAACQDLGGKDSKALWATQDLPNWVWFGGGDVGEPASGAVSSGGFLKENYFDEYI